jgi:uncharacterized 2Fe-2S/4Fe-4S cluster protein (DUF4445 family)
MTIKLNGKTVDVDEKRGESLYALMTGLGLRLNAPCGGGGRCGKCRVVIAGAKEPTETDRRLIDARDLDAGVRLACATAPFEGMDVRFEQTGERPAQIVTEGRSVSYPFAPAVALRQAVMDAPDLTAQASDLDRMAAALGMEQLRAGRATLRKLPGEFRRSGWKSSAVLRGSLLVDMNPGGVYGVAIDIGTTTLAGYLVDLGTGAQVALASALNPQKAWGDDVITRADVAGAGGLDSLQAAVAAEIDGMIGRMCSQAGIDRQTVYHVALAGNTVMMHLFAGVSPENIAQAPFIPAFTSEMEFSCAELGLHLHPHAFATLLPCVAGYVGADIVAGMLAVGMREDCGPSLLIDIGTNGEIALCAGGRLYACSTAAGPAFEGAHISSGMGGVEGAINKARVDGGVQFTTIGDAPARGICGSGLLDLIAGFLDAGAIDDTGRIDIDAAPPWVQIDNGKIVIDSDAGIYLTGRDIREVQLAKGAIAAGIDVLVAEANICLSDIERVWLAGGFGSYMDKRSAGRVGLIPAELVDKTVAVGNSSGAGARASLLSMEAMAEAARLAKAVKYVELSARKDFQDAFMDKMMF